MVKSSRHSTFVFMIAALFAAGIFGFMSSEGYSSSDAFHATIAAVTFSSDYSNYSAEGKLINSLLALASVSLIIWGFLNLRHSVAPEFEGAAQDYFKLMPQDEDLVLKEFKISAKSKISGKSKLQVLESTGSLVMAVRKGKEFQLNIPFDKKLAGKSTVLAFGTESQLKELEKQAR